MLRFGHCFGYGNDILDEGLHADWNRGSEVATRPGSRFLLCILPSHGWFRWFCWWFLGVCDTPVVGLFSKGFGGVGVGRVCVGGWVGVSYSLAAGRRGSPRWGGSGWPSGGGLRTQERVCTTL